MFFMRHTSVQVHQGALPDVSTINRHRCGIGVRSFIAHRTPKTLCVLQSVLAMAAPLPFRCTCAAGYAGTILPTGDWTLAETASSYGSHCLRYQ